MPHFFEDTRSGGYFLARRLAKTLCVAGDANSRCNRAHTATLFVGVGSRFCERHTMALFITNLINIVLSSIVPLIIELLLELFTGQTPG